MSEREYTGKEVEAFVCPDCGKDVPVYVSFFAVSSIESGRKEYSIQYTSAIETTHHEECDCIKRQTDAMYALFEGAIDRVREKIVNEANEGARVEHTGTEGETS